MLNYLLPILLVSVRAGVIAPRQGTNVCSANETWCGDRCVDLQTDFFHCGECWGYCSYYGNECRDGACVCSEGTDRCGEGCVVLETDPFNCGGCNIKVSLVPPSLASANTSAERHCARGASVCRPPLGAPTAAKSAST